MLAGYEESRMECLREFREHPAAAGQTYLQHMGFAVRFGLRMLVGGSAAIVHGLVPCWFQTTGSRTVQALHGRLQHRDSGHQDPLATREAR
jgi:hypothetical protein